MTALRRLARYYRDKRAARTPMAECSHGKWEVESWRGVEPVHVTLRCERCGLAYERPATKREAACSPGFFEEKAPADDIHYVWHRFCDEVLEAKTEGGELLRGYQLSLAAEEWAKKFPRHVRLVSCDDSHHSSSDLILVEHMAKRKYMGTTVVYIPQNGPVGEDLATGRYASFFLYGGHRWELMETLKQIDAQARKKGAAQNKHDLARVRRLARVLRVPSERELAQAALSGQLKPPAPVGKEAGDNAVSKKDEEKSR